MPFPQFNSDLHIHGKYSGGVSDDMLIPIIAKQATRKGIHIVGTGDAINPKWRAHIRESVKEDGEGAYWDGINATRFIITAEVEDNRRVHHLLILPSLSKADELYEKFKAKSVDIEFEGRPHVNLSAEEIAQATTDAGGLFGPCHAFVPWTSMYKEFGSLKECYGSMAAKTAFLELGLSADTSYADRIEELQNITFLSNSDCHSPWPVRLAREFTRFELAEATFPEQAKGILRQGGRKPTMNVKVYPDEGKYNRTACTRCFAQYSWEEATRMKRRCPECKGIIKKGVFDRVNELAAWPEARHPAHRPPCIHIIPLGEIISLALGMSSPYTKSVQSEWERIIDRFGNEVKVLLDAPMDEIKSVASGKVAFAIECFRKEKIIRHPGGGGKYGTFELPESCEAKIDEKPKNVKKKKGQLSIGDF